MNPHIPALVDFRFHLRHFLAFSEAASENLGITAQQYQLLQVVAQSPLPIREIADTLLIRHHSAVELIDRAALANLLTRTPDPADHRRSLIRITPHGRTVLDRLLAEHVRFLRQQGPTLIQSIQAVISC